MSEVACENAGTCDIDQQSFKAYLSRSMAATMKVAPFTRQVLLPLLQSSATAAAKACTGGTDGNTCGLKWTTGTFDGLVGIGQQMAALEVIQANLLDTVAGPVTGDTGGTSSGDPSGGTDSTTPQDLIQKPITTGSRVGAGFLTTFVLLVILGGAWWMVA